MNTPTHILWNLALLDRDKRPNRFLPVFIGAALPDVPTALCILYYRFSQGLPWQQATLQSHILLAWRFSVDLLHSIPLALIGIGACWLLKKTDALYLFASMFLHDLEDLPVHAQYAHRHFFPFSDWRFFSPVSYSDPAHYAAFEVPVEWLLVLAAFIVLWRRDLTPNERVSVFFLFLIQSLFVIYFFTYKIHHPD